MESTYFRFSTFHLAGSTIAPILSHDVDELNVKFAVEPRLLEIIFDYQVVVL